MERKLLVTTEAKVKANAAGEIEGYANTFGIKDRANEIVQRGAFADVVKAFNAGDLSLPLMDNHLLYEGTERVIGKVTALKEDSVGLWFRAVFSSVGAAQDVRTKIQEGLLDSLSIGYKVLLDELRRDGVRLLKKLDLREISVVVFPANEAATITSVKNLAASQARISAAQMDQAHKDLDYLEMRMKELKDLERRITLMEALAAKQHTESMTSTQLGYFI